MSHPIVRLHKGNEKKLLAGFPWVYQGEFDDTADLLMAEPGMLVALRSYRDDFLGIGYFNPKSQIACRILTSKNEAVDEAFFARRFAAALARREKIIPQPFYRLVHADSDGLPGLIVDRFDKALVCQVTTAGMEKLQPLWMRALQDLLSPETLVLRNDVPARTQEGLPQSVQLLQGRASEPVRVREYDRWYLADLLKGQKTGWFYDQRDNRELVAKACEGKRVLDVYCHSGGFGIAAAARGAASVTFVDSSAWALTMARQAAALNGVAERCVFREGQAFAVMDALRQEGERFEVVVADPPAFIPSKKDVARGLKGYEKTAKLAAPLVAPGGVLFIASCSHHASLPLFRKAVLAGLAKAGRKGTPLKQTGAASDHPVHPHLPQSEYLKGLMVRVD